MMRTFIIFSSIIGISFAATDQWTKLLFKFDPAGYEAYQNGNAFWEAPTMLHEALNSGWDFVSNQNEYGISALGWRGTSTVTDYRVVILYHQRSEHIVGIQIAVALSDIIPSQPTSYNYDKFRVYETKQVNGIPCLTSTLYLTNPRQMVYDVNFPYGLGNSLWFKNGTKSYSEVCTSISCMERQRYYKRQNCVPLMGTHYYQLNKDSDCESFFPWFLLTDVSTGDVIGGGWQTLGRTSHESRNWFDDVSGDIMKGGVPNAPNCLYKNIDTYGLVSIHFYFTEPWNYSCPK